MLDIVVEYSQVLDLLLHLAHGRTPEASPLVDLEIVRQGVEKAGFKDSPRAREHEIVRLVTEIVEIELSRLREEVGIAESTPFAGPQRLVDDFGHSRSELEAWSAVYHIYLRPDLDLGLKEADILITDRHRRTVQRRLERGVAALASRLQSLEHGAGRSALRTRLASRLPAAGARKLVGFDEILASAAALLAQEGAETPIALQGPAGCGKTELAGRLARRVIGSGLVEDLAWLELKDRSQIASLTSEGICRAVGSQLGNGSADGRASLRDLLSRRPHLIVLDGVDDPDVASSVVGALRDVLGQSVLLLTGRVGWAAFDDLRIVRVPPLTQEAAFELARRDAAVRGVGDLGPDDAQYLRPLLDATAGHPLAVLRAVRQLRATGLTRVVSDFHAGRGWAFRLYRDMWQSTWDTAPERAKEAVRALAGRSDSRCRPEASGVWGHPEFLAGPDDGMCAAVDRGLVTVRGDLRQRSYSLGLFLDRYLLANGDAEENGAAAA